MDWRGGAVLIAIAKCGKVGRKRYGVPGIPKLTELVNGFHPFNVSERTIRRDIKELKDSRWIQVIRRTRRDSTGKKVFTTNLYKFRKKFFIWLESLEKLAGDLFSLFHRPKMAVNKVLLKHGSSNPVASSVEKVRFLEKDGSVSVYDRGTGEVLPSRH
jgi:hypothetical protein